MIEAPEQGVEMLLDLLEHAGQAAQKNALSVGKRIASLMMGREFAEEKMEDMDRELDLLACNPAVGELTEEFENQSRVRRHQRSFRATIKGLLCASVLLSISTWNADWLKRGGVAAGIAWWMGHRRGRYADALFNASKPLFTDRKKSIAAQKATTAAKALFILTHRKKVDGVFNSKKSKGLRNAAENILIQKVEAANALVPVAMEEYTHERGLAAKEKMKMYREWKEYDDPEEETPPSVSAGKAFGFRTILPLRRPDETASRNKEDFMPPAAPDKTRIFFAPEIRAILEQNFVPRAQPSFGQKSLRPASLPMDNHESESWNDFLASLERQTQIGSRPAVRRFFERLERTRKDPLPRGSLQS